MTTKVMSTFTSTWNKQIKYQPKTNSLESDKNQDFEPILKKGNNGKFSEMKKETET